MKRVTMTKYGFCTLHDCSIDHPSGNTDNIATTSGALLLRYWDRLSFNIYMLGIIMMT
jgi:hypothetical protein